jgi:hypothetical protein
VKYTSLLQFGHHWGKLQCAGEAAAPGTCIWKRVSISLIYFYETMVRVSSLFSIS